MFRATCAVLPIACLLTTACDKGGDAPKPSGSAVASAAVSAPAKAAKPKADEPKADENDGKCAELGCDGKGDFLDKCHCAGKNVKSAITVKWTGKYDSGGVPELELTNTTDRQTGWASVTTYYYDKSGKQLVADVNGSEKKSCNENGGTLKLKPKETRTIGSGWSKKYMPEGVATVEAVIDGWCYEEPGKPDSKFCIDLGMKPNQDRPKQGK